MPHATINGVKIYYTMHGQGKPLVLLHGLGSNSRDWDHQVDVFSKSYTVICIDLRGHGQSSFENSAYSMWDIAQDVIQLIKALGFKKVHLLGFSLGGMAAFQLAVLCPELLLSLTIVNSTPEVIPHSAKEHLEFVVRRFVVSLLGMKVLGWLLGRRLFPAPDQSPLRKRLLKDWSTLDSDAYLASMDAIVGWSVKDKLHRITCPTHVITADMDYTSVEFKREYTIKIPNAELSVIEKSRHATPMDQPLTFNKCVLDFLVQTKARTLEPSSISDIATA